MSYCNVCKETMLSEWPHVHEPPGEQAHVHESLAATGTMLDERSDEITALRARLERVEGAAQPIAARAADYEGSNDHAWVGKTANGQPLRVGHLRALRLALRDEPPAEQEKKGGQDE